MNSYKITGNLSLLFGIVAALSCLSVPYLFYGMISAIIGFIFSVFNIFINTKDRVSKRKLTRAHVGMILSSIPVIYIFVVFIILKSN